LTESISFDRAAEYYDRTRSLPAAAEAEVTRLLEGELRGRGLVLEIGVGTGRIALPLARVGIPMVGADISPAMLRKLMEKAGADLFPLLVADAVSLPFPDGLFGAALVSHVLHLVPEWRRAVDELLRVVRPGGLLLVDMGGRRDSLEGVEQRFWREAHRRTEPVRREADEQLPVILGARGARRRELPPIEARGRQTIAERLANLEAGLFAACWSLDAETIARAAAAARRWAEEEYGDLEAEREVVQQVAWTAYELGPAPVG
jgi:ubiquinone/menaquinone biosynthesis C-methylase UbiE